MSFDLWTQFRNGFAQAINTSTVDELRMAWKSCKQRTKYYEDQVIPQIGKDLNLIPDTELFKVDHVLYAMASNKYKVPKIFIESENNADSADHEVRKLACLAAPLKVLIICVQWSEERGFWKNGGNKTRLLNKWKDILIAQNEVAPNPSILGIIVGEWNDDLRFYFLGLNEKAEVIDDEKILVQRTMN